MPTRPTTRTMAAAMVAALALAGPGGAMAAGPPDAADDAASQAAAIQLTERAVAHFRTVGREQALAEFSRRDGAFTDGESYVFCHDADGTVIAHGGNPALVGRNMIANRDPDGRSPTVELNRIGLTEGAGWYEFRWPNPVTRRIQQRAAYIMKVDDRTVCGSGYFKR